MTDPFRDDGAGVDKALADANRLAKRDATRAKRRADDLAELVRKDRWKRFWSFLNPWSDG
jgi:hypothetical protein